MDIDREAVMPIFLAESAENLAELEEALLRLEGAVDDDALVASVFRCAHTLKGNAEAIGLEDLAACAHALESVLDRVRGRTLTVTTRLVTVMLEAHDALRAMLAGVASGAPPEHLHRDVLDRLARAAAGPDDGGRSLGEPHGAAIHGGPAPRRETLRVALAMLDRILTITGELSIARARVRTVHARRTDDASMGDALAEEDRLFAELRDHVTRLRLVPIGPMFRQQLRVVRDLSESHGKLARLVLEGEGVEVDTAVVEALKGPILHMIRNAIDHGIETPAERQALGKAPVATIALSARHEAGRVVVEVSDDGRGFNRARILEQARKLGAIGESDHPSDADVDRLVFAPGFSTSDVVTDLSGRGVGMDVVARNVADLKGSVAVETVAGRGATFTIRVPLTLAIIQGFAVTSAGETYVIPLDSVRECIELPTTSRAGDDGSGVINLRGDVLPYVRLRELFGLRGDPPASEQIVVVEHHNRRAGLAVDELHGENQAVVKPLGQLLERIGGVTGSTILGDGRVALILDVASLMNEATSRAARATDGAGDRP